MLKDRGYNVPDSRLNLSLEHFRVEHGVGDAIREAMTIVVAKLSDPQDQVCSEMLSLPELRFLAPF
jgi:hypothetical protein